MSWIRIKNKRVTCLNNQVKVIVDLSKHQGELKQQQRDVQKRIAQTRRQIDIAIRKEIEDARREAEAKAAAAAKVAAAKAKAENREVVAPKTKVINKASTNSEVLNATPEAAKLSNDFLGNRGRLPWPVANGQLIHGFGTFTDSEGIKSDNNGYEIRTNSGAAVRSVFDGEVVRIVDVYGAYLIIIKHGEYFTSYSNLRTLSVVKGQKVTTKQVIGTVATDPITKDASIIFSLYKGKDAVNPKLWLADN